MREYSSALYIGIGCFCYRDLSFFSLNMGKNDYRNAIIIEKTVLPYSLMHTIHHDMLWDILKIKMLFNNTLTSSRTLGSAPFSSSSCTMSR